MHSLEPLAYQRLRQAVERAVTAGRGHEVVELLSVRSPLNGFGSATATGLEVLSGGFGAGISSASRMPFTAFCLKSDEPDVLRAVLSSDMAAPEELLRLAGTVRRAEVSDSRRADAQRAGLGIKPAKRLTESHQDIWAASLALNNAAGIAIGFEFDSGNARLTQCIRTGPMDQGDTLHAQALGLALGYLNSRDYWRAKSARFICQAFVKQRAPVSRYATSNYIMDLFVTTDVQSDFAVEHKDLFDMYAQAGYLEPDRRLTGYASHKDCANLLPLTGAVLHRNRVVALGLIELGADTMGVGSDVGKPELGAVDVARMGRPKVANAAAAARAQEEDESFAAELAQAVMARTIGRASIPTDSGEAPAPRRRRASV
jgi:hypothetical protein